MTLEQQLGLLRIVKAQSEQITALSVSLKSLTDAVWDDRTTLGDRYWRYHEAQLKDHEAVTTNAQVVAQIDRWIKELQS